MKDFLKHDWANVEMLILDGCQIDNDSWRMLVANADRFNKVGVLSEVILSLFLV